MRRVSRCIRIGSVPVGGNSPITIQSMTNTRTEDVDATVAQIKQLEEAGCDIIRVAVPSLKAASVLGRIKDRISIPLVADIHFDYRIALEAIGEGVDGLRINPGNIGDKNRIQQVVRMAKKSRIPIRIGVNSGSLEKDILEKFGSPTAEALVESGLRHVAILESLDFYDIKISLKSSDVSTTVKAYRMIGEKVDYPLHLGVTEAGTLIGGTVKSSIGIGSLLLDGIGDTIRVSLTEDPVREIEVGKEILRSLGLYRKGIEIISCPTCGRCSIDLIKIASRVADEVKSLDKPLKIAIMGCAVNGPGEAREADLGIAGGKDKGVIFRKGKIIRTVKEEELVDALMEEIEKY